MAPNPSFLRIRASSLIKQIPCQWQAAGIVFKKWQTVVIKALAGRSVNPYLVPVHLTIPGWQATTAPAGAPVGWEESG
jgi:hypothetical protein